MEVDFRIVRSSDGFQRFAGTADVPNQIESQIKVLIAPLEDLIVNGISKPYKGLQALVQGVCGSLFSSYCVSAQQINNSAGGLEADVTNFRDAIEDVAKIAFNENCLPMLLQVNETIAKLGGCSLSCVAQVLASADHIHHEAFTEFFGCVNALVDKSSTIIRAAADTVGIVKPLLTNLVSAVLNLLTGQVWFALPLH